MGLSFESIKDMFNFVLKYPISFVFMFLVDLIILIGVLILAGGVLVSVLPLLRSTNEVSSSPLLSLLRISTLNIAGGIVFAIVGFLILLIGSLIHVGGFPLLVYQAVKKRRIYLNQIFRLSFKNIPRTLVTSIIWGLIILLPILPAFVSFVFTIKAIPKTEVLTENMITSLGTFLILFVVGIVIAFYLAIKLWLTFPILMIEGKSPLDSLRSSWHTTNNFFWSIVFVMILFSLFVGLPTAILNILFSLAGPIPSFIWIILYNIVVGALSGVLPTIYYLNRRHIRRR